MRYILISIIIGLCGSSLYSQTITAGEYFFDIDPGFGSGVSMTITSGTSIDEDFSIDISALSDGFHMLYVRLQDNEGDWSLLQNRPIFKTNSNPNAIIAGAEIFFDQDPGFGLGTILPITSGGSIDEDSNVDISGLSDGFHMMYIRVQDDDGDWSMVENRPIYKSGSNQISMITAAEIFYDEDPGFGNGGDLGITMDDTLDLSFSLDIDTLSYGFHMMYIRVQDDDGDWSMVENQPIYKSGSNQISMITAAEIFYDEDPGFGNGGDLGITMDDTLDLSFSLGIDTLSDGFHMMYIRVHDDDGDWSMVENRPIYKSGSNQISMITAAEIFYDEDPGFGNGGDLGITMDDTLDLSFSLDIDTLSDGFHMMYIRVQDDDGDWSMVENRPFYKSGNGINPQVVKYETFIDNDPGFGIGSAYTSFTPAEMQESEFGIDLTSISIGTHVLYIRALDDQGNWSMVANMPFEKTTCGNGIKDGDEEYVDCGGSKCLPCMDCEDIALQLSDQPFADQRFARAKQTITSDGLVTDNTLVIFQAGNSIMLSNDFEIRQEATFEALIADCNSN